MPTVRGMVISAMHKRDVAGYSTRPDCTSEAFPNRISRRDENGEPIPDARVNLRTSYSPEVVGGAVIQSARVMNFESETI